MMISKEIDIKKPLTPAQMEMVKKAENMPITFDEDSPELTVEQLKKFYRARVIEKSL